MKTQLAWYSFQIAVAVGFFIWSDTWANHADLGLAPYAVAIFVSWLSTGLLARLFMWWSARRTRLSEQAQSDRLSLSRTNGHSGDSAKLIDRTRVG